MEYLSGLASYMILSRNQMDYTEHNENIHKLIEQLGDKIQKDLVTLEQQILLNFKDSLVSTQKQYKALQMNRNDEVIKEKILLLKSEQEKIFSQEEQKSLEMNKVYDKLKVDLKRAIEYKHELELEIKFLTKQTAIAQKKNQLLDEQINEFHDETAVQIESLTTTYKKNFFLPSLKKPLFKRTDTTTRTALERENRTKCKIQSMKEYIEYLSQDETAIEKIFKKYDIAAAKTEKEKVYLMESVFNDPTFRKYLYHVLFKANTKPNSGNKENCVK